MFNYLQERRPKRRKSANLLNVFSSQKDTTTRNVPDPSSATPAPASDTSPDPRVVGSQNNMSPITRLASRQKRPKDGPQAEKQTHWSFKGDRPHTSASHGSFAPAAPIYGGSTTYPGLLQPAGTSKAQDTDSAAASDRPKRLIDVRFDQMRAAQAPVFQHSTFDAGLQTNITGTQPFYQAPPPPPKTAPSNQYHEQDSSSVAVPTLSQPTSERAKQSLSRPQRRPFSQHQLDAEVVDKPINQARFSRPKLNLMNPMQILSRRRSQRPPEPTFAENQTTPAPQLPADYDPRIRGKLIHDFSAPKPIKQDVDYTSPGARESVRLVSRDDSPQSQERDHAAVFTEEFSDGLEKSQDPATRPEAFRRTAAVQASQDLQADMYHLPEFAPKLPLKIATGLEKVEQTGSERPKPGIPALEIVVESPDVDQSKPLPFPPRATSASTSLSDRTVSGLGSPQRHKSNSSRFSFDLAGVGSTVQEKLLEDKHREKVQQKQRESVLSYTSTNDAEQYDEFDDMDDGGFEERIPGVNCDEDMEAPQNNLPTLRRDVEHFPYASPNKSSFESTDSPVSTGVTSLDTPFFSVPWASSAASKSTPNLAGLPSGNLPSTETVHEPRIQSDPADSHTADGTAKQPRMDNLDDDIYFDDGLIDEIGDISDTGQFDEDVFDDTGNGLYGVPLRDRTIKPSDTLETSTIQESQSGIAPQNSIIGKPEDTASSVTRSLSSGAVSAELRDALTDLGHPNILPFNHTAGLTHDNLAAYNQNSLVNAVNQAALNGTFDRTYSLQSTEDPPKLPALNTSLPEQSATAQPLQTHLPANLRGGFSDPDLQHNSYNDLDDFSALDDDDDDIVAEANALALENDADGFYGTEFGFYARSSSSTTTNNTSSGNPDPSSSTLTHGGYFNGKTLSESIHRSHSGKATNFQEPSLTPITERSEWSNRNSTISLAQLHHAYGFPSMPTSPGWGEFGVPGGQEGLETQIQMLKQLRRGAWGGSDGSLPSASSGGSQTRPQSGVVFGVSPLQHQGLSNSASNSTSNLQKLSTSFPSETSNDSDGGDHNVNSNGNGNGSNSPTITLQSPTTTTSVFPPTNSTSTSMPPPPLPASAASKQALATGSSSKDMVPSDESKQSGQRHERTHSGGGGGGGGGGGATGAESISYTTSNGKWVMEKRRMSESGEPMMVGRRVLEAGMI